LRSVHVMYTVLLVSVLIMTTNVYYYVHFDFTKFAIFGDPVLRQLELRSVHVMYTVLLVSVLTVRIFE
jgi:hypothetical protein